jgi:hypothetical protein
VYVTKGTLVMNFSRIFEELSGTEKPITFRAEGNST